LWTTAVLVHGLYTPGIEMTLLRRRLEQAGIRCHQYRYPSLTATPADNAERLFRFTESITADRLDFVAHSLGGLIVRHLFARHADLRPGRIVTLGTPHRGSAAARWLSTAPFGALALGRSGEAGLLGDSPEWDGKRELGSIAGRLRLGLGCLVPGVPRPSDGTVAVAETRLAGMTDHLTVAATHFGLLLSARAAVQTVAFLRDGRFNHTS
jgi:pimeloyl-ACP methyl ester carboxylesterase